MTKSAANPITGNNKPINFTPKAELQALLQDCLADRRKYIETFFKIHGRDVGEIGLNLVPFKFTKVQDDYWATRTARDVYLKARQVTMSSIIQADYTAEAMLTPGLNVLVLVQKPEDQTLMYHRRRVQTFIDSVPVQIRPKVVVSNDHQITFEFKSSGEKHYTNMFFASSGSQAVGRGATIHRVHITEFASWEEQDAEEILTTLLGLPKDSRVCIESSPKGASGPLYKLWRLATRREGNYTPHLYEWWWENAYRVENGETGYDGSAEEAKLTLKHALGQDQINWRRNMIREAANVKGEDYALQGFLQEYLEDDVTCFLLSGSPAFDTLYLESLSKSSRPPVYTRGDLRVWLPAEPGEAYVIGADPAEGLVTSNLSAAVVRKASNWDHVATLRGRIAPKDFAGYLATLGREYNLAVINVERNNHGHTVLDNLLTYYRYPHLFRHFLNYRNLDDARFGFQTNSATKGRLVSAERDLINLRAWLTYDRELIEQARIYEELGSSNSTIKFSGEHDDILMADMLALAARSQARTIKGSERKYVLAQGG
jgi:hypothetical protein